MSGIRRSVVRVRGSSGTCALVVAALLSVLTGPSARAEGPSGDVPESPDTAALSVSAAAVPDSAGPGEPLPPRPDRVVVYYFHRTLRCDTCLKFETYTEEALRSAYADELSEEELEWYVVNLDDPGNEHFEDDYYITENSVVVVEFRGGEQREWANLDAIWGFVTDKPTFLSYIRGEVDARLDMVRTPESAATGSVRDTAAQASVRPDRR